MRHPSPDLQSSTLASIEADSSVRGPASITIDLTRPDSPPQHLSAAYQRLDFADIRAPRLTHYLFRFPAKFHAPVVHSLLRSYTASGETVLDPFCGSGTLLVAAAAEGRNAVGIDVDPVAVFVSKGKTHRYRIGHLKNSWDLIRSGLPDLERSSDEYDIRRFDDLEIDEYNAVVSNEELWVPRIPNLLHWFRRYVIVDLARLLQYITRSQIPSTHKAFLRLMFASIIRSVSNADPVPVSGLEVTSHMKALDAAGRRINPFDFFSRAVNKGLTAMGRYCEVSDPKANISVIQADVRSLPTRMWEPVDAIITSPPYYNAVDYYRRHQLEMYWLGLTLNHRERLTLAPRYIGRYSVRYNDPQLKRLAEVGKLAEYWFRRIDSITPERARAFLHYVVSMKDVVIRLARMVRPDTPVIFVLGNNTWNGQSLPISELVVELAKALSFELVDAFWYPVKNRYMSYSRRNGASIDKEYVLVFSRSTT